MQVPSKAVPAPWWGLQNNRNIGSRSLLKFEQPTQAGERGDLHEIQNRRYECCASVRRRHLGAEPGTANRSGSRTSPSCGAGNATARLASESYDAIDCRGGIFL